MHHFEMHHFEHHWHPMDYGNGVGMREIFH